MFGLISDVLKDCCTGKDGQSYDIGRVGTLVGILALIALQGWSTYQTGKFDAQSFGIAFGVIVGGGCAGVGWKAHTEPEPEEPTIEGMPRDR